MVGYRGPKTTNLDLLGFDYSKMGPNALSIFLGKRDSGKTTWARYKSQLSQHARRGAFIVIAGSEKVKAAWSEIVPAMFVRDPSLELLNQLKKQQNDLIAKYLKLGKPFPPELHLTIIMDDVGTAKWFMRSKEIMEFSSNGRQWETDIVICLQYLKMIPPEVRENIDYIFLLSTGNTSTMKILVEEYVSCATVKLLSKIIEVVTQDYGALVISNCKNTRSILDTCFHSRVPTEYLEDKTMLGGPEFLKFASKYNKDPNKPEINTINTEIESIDETEDLDPIIEHMCEDRYGRIVIRCLPKGDLYKRKQD